MGYFKINPIGIQSAGSLGSLTSTAGSSNVNILSTLTDSNSTTYAYLSGAGTFSRNFVMDNPVLPDRARVTQLRARWNARATGSTVRVNKAQLYLGTQANPSVLAPLKGTFTGSATVPIGTFRALRGPVATDTNNQELITQPVLNQLQMQLFGFSTTDIRISELWVDCFYDEIPTVSNISPGLSGELVDTQTPVITWTYYDEHEAQYGYQIEILDSSDTVVYESGQIVSGDTFHQVTTGLPPYDTYTVKMRVMQYWDGPGGRFWSNWTRSADDFTVNVASLPTVEVKADPVDASAYNTVTAYHNLNLFSYDDASFENGLIGWNQVTSGTIATNTNLTYILDGNASLKVTQSGATTTVYCNNKLRVAEGVRYGFSIWSLVDAASTLGTLNGRVNIDWYDGAGAFISTSQGSTTLLSKVDWVYHEMTVTAPSGAAYARAYIQVASGASTRIIYFDLAMFTPMDATTVNVVDWSSGGLLDPTTNLLSAADASAEADMLWIANDATTAVTSSTTQKRHGTTSLALQRIGGVTGATWATIDGQRIQIEDVEQFDGLVLCASIYPTVGTGFGFSIQWYDEGNVYLETTGLTYASGSWTLNTWQQVSQAVALPADPDASYGIIYVNFTGVTNTSFNYVDAMAIYNSSVDIGWKEGSRDLEGPYLVVEALDIEGIPDYTRAEWLTLQSDNPSLFATYEDLILNAQLTETTPFTKLYEGTIDPFSATYTFNDRSCRNGVARFYRGYVRAIKDVSEITSAGGYAFSVNNYLYCPVINFRQSWLSTIDPEVDGYGNVIIDGYDSYNFVYDGGGRSEDIENESTLVRLVGRIHPVAVFGGGIDQSLKVTLQLVSAADRAAFLKLVQRNTLVLFRDHRGRRLKGLLAQVSWSDTPWGQEVSFTLTASGIQYT